MWRKNETDIVGNITHKKWNNSPPTICDNELDCISTAPNSCLFPFLSKICLKCSKCANIIYEITATDSFHYFPVAFRLKASKRNSHFPLTPPKWQCFFIAQRHNGSGREHLIIIFPFVVKKKRKQKWRKAKKKGANTGNVNAWQAEESQIEWRRVLSAAMNVVGPFKKEGCI